ncbi:MAG: 6-bladed beta-propeller [Bacteroidales bacterium]
MKSHRFQKFLACLGLVLLLVSAEFSFGQEANRPVKSAGSRKIVIDFPSDIPDWESLQKQAGMMAGHMDSCSLIQLETRPECLVGEIDKIFFYKDRLYILDRRVGKSVFVFDLKGKWISTIARSGHGPGEYINITDMFIDPIRETLNLVAFANRKVMSFSLDGKKLLSETTYSYPIISMEVSKTGTIVGSSGNTPMDNSTRSTVITFRDPSLVTPNYMALPIFGGWYVTIGGESALVSCKGNVYYRQAIKNKIYKVAPDALYLAYEFDFKSHSPDPNLTQEQYDNFSLQQRANTILRIVRFSELKEGILAEVIFRGSAKWIFITENYSKIEVIQAITNPFMQSLGFGMDVGLSENCIISRLTYKSVATALASKDFPERAAFLKKYLHNPIKEDDNPILCVYHLK